MRYPAKENVRLEIHPWRFWGRSDNTERDIKELEELIPQIRRHCDVSKDQQICLEWDTVGRCDACHAKWAEDSPFFNGGCCAADASVILDMDEADAEFWGLLEYWRDWRAEAEKED